MKKLIFTTLVLLLSTIVFSQDSTLVDSTSFPFETIEDVANEVIKVITSDPEAGGVVLPEKIDVSNTQNLFEWWMFLYSLIMPLGLWLFHRFWPSSNKSELIIKSTSVGIVVLLIIIFSKGVTIAVIGQAILAFLMKVLTYDKFYKPLGVVSPKTQDYKIAAISK